MSKMQEIQDMQGFYEVVQTPDATHIRFEVISDIGSYIPPHWHDALEILLLLEGQMEITDRQKKHLLTPDDCFLFDMNVPHSTKCIHASRYLLVQIPMEFLSPLLPDIDQLSFHFELPSVNPQVQENVQRLKELLQQMRQLEETRPDGYLLAFNSLLYQCLSLLYEKFSLKLPGHSRHLPSRNQKRLEVILAYTLESYRQPISIENVASVVALQPEYFCRFFKKYMGITYLEYLNRIRLSHIYRDLISTQEPIHMILEKHGFTNYKLFRRMFSEQFHATPSQIRRQAKRPPSA